MSAATDPIWSLFLWLGVVSLILGIVAVAASNGLVWVLAWVDRRGGAR